MLLSEGFHRRDRRRLLALSPSAWREQRLLGDIPLRWGPQRGVGTSCTSPLDPDISPFAPYSRFAVRRRRSCSWYVPMSACPAAVFSACRRAQHHTRCEGGRGQTAFISGLLAFSPRGGAWFTSLDLKDVFLTPFLFRRLMAYA